MTLMQLLKALLVGSSLIWPVTAQADSATLDELFVYLSQDDAEAETRFIDEAPAALGFEGNAIAVYADHLKKSWQDPTIRGYLANRLGNVMRFSEGGEPDIDAFGNVLVIMPIALSARGDYGAYRLTPTQKIAYIQALHNAFLAEAEKGLDACLEAHNQVFGHDREALYQAARHKLTLMRNMNAKDLQSYLQVQRAAVLAELRATSEASTLTSDGLDNAFSYIDPVLDRLVKDHPMAERINAYWYTEVEDREAECEAFKLDWVVVRELEGEGQHLASQYYLEFFNGEH